MIKKHIFIGILLGLIPNMVLGYSARYNQLVQEKERKMAELEKCQGSTKGLKIAGISTLGLTAVGVAGNIVEAKKLGEYDTKIEKTKTKIASTETEIENKQAEIIAKQKQVEEEKAAAAANATVGGNTASADSSNGEQAANSQKSDFAKTSEQIKADIAAINALEGKLGDKVIQYGPNIDKEPSEIKDAVLKFQERCLKNNNNSSKYPNQDIVMTGSNQYAAVCECNITLGFVNNGGKCEKSSVPVTKQNSQENIELITKVREDIKTIENMTVKPETKFVASYDYGTVPESVKEDLDKAIFSFSNKCYQIANAETGSTDQRTFVSCVCKSNYSESNGKCVIINSAEYKKEASYNNNAAASNSTTKKSANSASNSNVNNNSGVSAPERLLDTTSYSVVNTNSAASTKTVVGNSVNQNATNKNSQIQIPNTYETYFSGAPITMPVDNTRVSTPQLNLQNNTKSTFTSGSKSMCSGAQRFRTTDSQGTYCWCNFSKTGWTYWKQYATSFECISQCPKDCP